MTLIKIPIPETTSTMEIVVAVDLNGPDNIETENDEHALKFERVVGQYLSEMLKKIGVKNMEVMQD